MPETQSILQEIIRQKKLRLARAKEEKPLSELITRIRDLPGTKDFTEAIGTKNKVNIIAELKRRSPSKGIIRKNYNIEKIFEHYEKGGADACSVLTEEDFFGGCLEDLRNLRKLTKKPLLRKDFIFDSYQVFEAREAGADAVLLIAAVLNQNLLQNLISLCTGLELSALVEVHTRKELYKALDAGAEILGINNRNLNTFKVNIKTAVELKKYIPPGKIIVSESGIAGPDDIEYLCNAGINTFLIGEYLLKAQDITRALKELKSMKGSV